MSVKHHKIIFDATIRDAEDTDDVSLEFGRNILLGLYTEGNLYDQIDSLTLICDRGEVRCECHEFTLASPTYHLSVKNSSGFALVAWNSGKAIAGGVWQLVWSKDDNRYMFQTVSSAGIDLVHVDGHQRNW